MTVASSPSCYRPNAPDYCSTRTLVNKKWYSYGTDDYGKILRWCLRWCSLLILLNKSHLKKPSLHCYTYPLISMFYQHPAGFAMENLLICLIPVRAGTSGWFHSSLPQKDFLCNYQFFMHCQGCWLAVISSEMAYDRCTIVLEVGISFKCLFAGQLGGPSLHHTLQTDGNSMGLLSGVLFKVSELE